MDKSNYGCEYCQSYTSTTDYRMYCTKLMRRITARKKPCKHFKHYAESESFNQRQRQGVVNATLINE